MEEGKPTEQPTPQAEPVPAAPTALTGLQPPAGSAKHSKRGRKKKPKQHRPAPEINPAIAQLQPSAIPGNRGHINMDQILKQLRAAGINPQTPHRFWNTQPVPHNGESVEVSQPAPIEAADKVIPREPLPLPPGYEWFEVDVTSDVEMEAVYNLLSENYVEDNDSMFRFNYSIPFLRWALMPPGFKRVWHVGVRVQATQKIVGFITGVPQEIRTMGQVKPMVEINFLCVHKKLRAKRLAPVLIREVTRRVNLEGIFQAVYTAGVEIPTPISKTRYFHRSLNPKKLVAVGFSRLQPRLNMRRTEKLFRIPEATTIPGFRPFQPADVPVVRQKLNAYLTQFAVAPEFTSDEELAHWLLPRDEIVQSFVVEDPETHEITDFGSFYILPSFCIGNEQYPTLKAAYNYYYFTGKHTLRDLLGDMLVKAKHVHGCDVYNMLDVMHNSEVMSDLKFGPGDGNLHYYLFNWRVPTLEPPQVGVVLL
eukprot:gnl/Trimastix_PCT/1726.p2 GENE.gnl/Trimastix_PCT/1726~~gnl/Trimastix_PCT/1726.p2  ORF type:complete len:491 (-),score=166.66 gnl/Trimastix_PCT/1726:1199-2632(-)